jgi:hypothetical protein
LSVSGSTGTFRWPAHRCGADKWASVTLKIDASGALTGTSAGFTDSCGPHTAQIWGRASGGRVSVESRGNLRATFVKK